jgi:hypothetical protein
MGYSKIQRGAGLALWEGRPPAPDCEGHRERTIGLEFRSQAVVSRRGEHRRCDCYDIPSRSRGLWSWADLQDHRGEQVRNQTTCSRLCSRDGLV